MATYTIENGKLSVTIAAHGAELSSIYDKENGRELVWQADPTFWNRHAPVLFPNVGKYYGGYFTYNGKEYPMGQHGFARDTEFEEVAAGEDFVTYRLSSNETTKKEIDIIIQKDGKVIPIEVKSGNTRANSLKSIMKNNKDISFGYKFIDGNIGVSEEGIITLPLYMVAFFDV